MFGFVFGLLGAAAFVVAGLADSARKASHRAEFNNHLNVEDTLKRYHSIHAQTAEY